MPGETLVASVQVQPVLRAAPKLIKFGLFAQFCCFWSQLQSLDGTFKPVYATEVWRSCPPSPLWVETGG